MSEVSDGLDLANLTPVASLNRVRFTELAGLPIPAGMVGWAAYALLSAKALADLTTRHGSADEAARRFGERLGWLLATLKRGDPASRAARPDWDDTYWGHWAAIRQVFLGGGVVSGSQGPVVAEHAERLLSRVGITNCTVAVAPWPEHLPLVGAARSAHDASATVVLDFGQSFVKRGWALAENGSLTALRLLPRQPARWTDLGSRAEPPIEDVRALADFMIQSMVDTWRKAQETEPEVSTTVATSIASYVHDGQPLPRQGGAYPQLLRLTDNVERWLSERLSEESGRPMAVRLLHDGTAAARALAGEPHAAVITLGTALGVGFPSSATPCLPLSPRFALLDAVRR